MSVTPETLVHALHAWWPQAGDDRPRQAPWSILLRELIGRHMASARLDQVVAQLDEHFLDPAALAALHPEQLLPWLPRVPNANARARAVVECARFLCQRHGGQVPADRDQLAALPGVDAQVVATVLSEAFDIPAVIPHAHVCRVLQRIGWIHADDAQAASEAIVQRVEPQHWQRLNQQLGRLGAVCCRPLRPRCEHCPIGSLCPRRNVESRDRTRFSGRPDRG